MTGVYWGRFNPPHKGHLFIIKTLIKEVDTLIIAIGSAEIKNTKRNPFDGNERKIMMKVYLKENKLPIRRIKIITDPDGKSFSSGIKNLFRLCGKFDVIYTDKKTIIDLISNKVKIKKIKRKVRVSSTQIRDAIAKDKSWENLTGISVVKTIKGLNGINRIKKSYR